LILLVNNVNAYTLGYTSIGNNTKSEYDKMWFFKATTSAGIPYCEFINCTMRISCGSAQQFKGYVYEHIDDTTAGNLLDETTLGTTIGDGSYHYYTLNFTMGAEAEASTSYWIGIWVNGDSSHKLSFRSYSGGKGGTYSHSSSTLPADGTGFTIPPYTFSIRPFYITYNPPNQAPTLANELPNNNSFDNPLGTSQLQINISDAESDNFNFTWGCSDGSSGGLNNQSDGQFNLSISGDLDCGTTYTWWVNTSQYDDPSKYTNETYSFRTSNCSLSYLSVIPLNNSVDVCPCFTPLCFNVLANDDFNVNYTIYLSNDTGFYIYDNQDNVSDGEYCICLCGLRYNQSYQWYVNVSRYGNSSVYNQTPTLSFTTAENISICMSVLVGETMEITLSEFGVIISFLMFAFFFWIGYTSDKRSGGALMLFAGFIMFYLEYVLIGYVSIVFVIPFISPLAIFIILLGVKKFLYYDEQDAKKKPA
jgi:hypothetical protein